MQNIKKILFPVDFSERAAAAANYVESLAGRFDAEVMLLHVMDAGAHGPIAHHLHASREEELANFKATEFAPYSTRRICVLGDPAEEIVKMTRSWAPDLVMMPSYGMGFYRPALIGSVTAKVLHDVSCPVWTSVHSQEAPELEGIHYDRVLCAVDLGERSQPVYEWARSFACEYQAELGIVHATPPMDIPEYPFEVRERIAALFGDAGARIFVDCGETARTVACAAKEFGADVLVIGRYSVSGDDGYLRHNAYGIIRESPCPVVSI